MTLPVGFKIPVVYFLLQFFDFKIRQHKKAFNAVFEQYKYPKIWTITFNFAFVETS